MNFVQFCQAHGILIHSEPPIGRWVRYPTTDHPKSRNGAVKFLGDIGFCQNHATQTDVSQWRPDSNAPNIDTQAIANKAAEFERRMVEGWERAAKKAEALIREAKHMPHAYLQNKGFKDTLGLVLADETLVIPMRNHQTNKVQGAQLIRWNSDERKFEKKMLPGMRAKGAVFRIGSPVAPRTWLVEGFATGLSVEAAVRLLNLRDSVLVCFSDGNLVHVASQIRGECFVFADNDESGAGERAAKRSGLRYCMAGTVGHDANDMHKAEGIFKVASLMVDATLSEPAS